MRSVGNFHPEWGYLAPAPGFLRTLRVAVVATAIGATAGAVVVVSLVERPGANDDTTSIAAHALVTRAPIVAAPVVSASPVSRVLSATVPRSPVRPAVRPAQASVAPVQTPNRPAPQSVANASGMAANAQTANVASPAAVPAQASIAVASPAVADEVAPLRPDQAALSDASSAKKVLSKRRRVEPYPRRWQSTAEAKKRWNKDGGFGPLLRLFSFRAGSLPFLN